MCQKQEEGKQLKSLLDVRSLLQSKIKTSHLPTANPFQATKLSELIIRRNAMISSPLDVQAENVAPPEEEVPHVVREGPVGGVHLASHQTPDEVVDAVTIVLSPTVELEEDVF